LASLLEISGSYDKISDNGFRVLSYKIIVHYLMYALTRMSHFLCTVSSLLACLRVLLLIWKWNKNKPKLHQALLAHFPVICVGGSAGGLDAYTWLLRHLPADMGAAIITVDHLRTMATMFHEISRARCRLN